MATHSASCPRFIRLRFKFHFPTNGYSRDIANFRFQFLCKGLLLRLSFGDIFILDFHFSPENLDSDFGFHAAVRAYFRFLGQYFGSTYIYDFVCRINTSFLVVDTRSAAKRRNEYC